MVFGRPVNEIDPVRDADALRVLAKAEHHAPKIAFGHRVDEVDPVRDADALAQQERAHRAGPPGPVRIVSYVVRINMLLSVGSAGTRGVRVCASREGGQRSYMRSAMSTLCYARTGSINKLGYDVNELGGTIVKRGRHSEFRSHGQVGPRLYPRDKTIHWCRMRTSCCFAKETRWRGWFLRLFFFC